MKQFLSLKQFHIKAIILGFIFIIIGVVFFLNYLFNPTSLNLKLAFASIILGTFVIFLMTEQSIPKKTSDANIAGNIDTVSKFIRDLRLKGNAVFLPKNGNLTEERILIPPNKTGIVKIPDIDDNYVFLTGTDGENLGIAIPPSGLKLLKEIEKDTDFENIDVENIEEKLQKFVGMNVLKSISFKKQNGYWKLELEKPIFCPNDEELCKQYPCPTCSAVIVAITRALKEKIRIYDTSYNGKKIKFYINFIKRRDEQGNK